MNRIWAFGDTHGNEKQLKVPDNIDIAIFSGDAGTYRDAYMNEKLVIDFINWFSELDIAHKVMIAGNHDSSIEKGLVKHSDFKDRGIVYLEDELTLIEDITIYGSPWTPTFGNWSFNKSRNKIHMVWDQIPPNVDILVTHGPPKGILDLTENRDKSFELCGCANLYKQVTERIKPKYHMFGHIHNRYGSDYHNAGVLQIPNCNTIFSNGSVVEDGKMNQINSNGNIVYIK